MPNDPRIEDVARKWHAYKLQGQRVSLEALCADCPELLPELRKRVGEETLPHPGTASTPALPATISAESPAKSGGLSTVNSMSTGISSRPAQSAAPAPPSARQIADWIVSQEISAAAGPEVRQLADTNPDQRAFGKELVQRGWLTPFQVNRLLQGRAHELIVGGYVLLEKLGEGGMGVVYKARQRDLRRIVALKMILSGAISSSQLARFRLEAEAVARLQHPNVVQIFEVSAHEGKPFFSLEFVEGGTLKAILEKKPQPPRACAQLLETIARAMQVAHQHGILHRDLKPANILMQVPPSDPGNAEGWKLTASVPKIADFGLAKKLDDDASGQTHSGAVMGTPSYMAPEQAAGRVHELGPAADVYALGAILYEALTGRPPFREESVAQTLEKVIHEEPIRPRNLVPAIPADLETICLKCLEKEPARRYASAAALAEDLRRYLDDEPIKARPATRTERVLKWMRRHPARTASYALSLLALVLLIGGGMAFWFWRDAESARAAADEARGLEAKAKTEVEDALLKVKQANSALEAAQDKLARLTTLQQVRDARKSWLEGQYAAARNILEGCPEHYRDWEWHYLRRLFTVNEMIHDSHVQGISFCAQGRYLATSEGVWDTRENKRVVGKAQVVPADGHRAVVGVAISPDGKTLATGVGKGVKLRALPSGKELATLNEKDIILRLDYCDDGSLILGKLQLQLGKGGGDLYIIEALNPATGKTHWVNPPDLKIGNFSVALKKPLVLVHCTHDKTLRLLDWRKGKEIWKRDKPTSGAFALSRDGALAAIVQGDNSIQVLRTSDASVKATLGGHSRPLEALAFSPDGAMLAGAERKGPVALWNLNTSLLVRQLHGAAGGASQLAFSPDGSLLACDSEAPSLVVWDLGAEHEVFQMTGCRPMRGNSLHPGGEMIFVRPIDFPLYGRKLSDGQGMFAMQDDIFAAEPLAKVFRLYPVPAWKPVSPDGRFLARWHRKDSQVFIQSVPDGKTVTVIDVLLPPEQLLFSDDGSRLALADANGVKVVSMPQGKEVASFLAPGAAHDLAFSRDGNVLARRDKDFSVQAWSLSSGKELLNLPAPKGEKAITDGKEGIAVPPNGLALNHDGTLLAALTGKTEIGVWHVPSGALQHRLFGHQALVSALQFHPKGTRLASLDHDGTVRIWDLILGQEVLVMRTTTPEPLEVPYGLCFSADGKRLVAGPVRGDSFLWETETDVKVQRERRDAWHVNQGRLQANRKLEVTPGDEADPKSTARYAALFHFNWAIHLNPANHEAWLERGRFYTRYKVWTNAAHDFQEALKLRPGDSQSIYSAGVALLADKKRPEYTRVLREAWKNPDAGNQPMLLVWLAVLDRDGIENGTDVLAALDREEKKSEPSVATLTARGMVLYRMKRYPEALAAFDAATDLRLSQVKKTGRYIPPLTVWTQTFRAMTLQQLGRGDEAAQALAPAVKRAAEEPRLAVPRIAWQTLVGNSLLVQEAEDLIRPADKGKAAEK